jgi:heparanase 1
MRSKKAVQRAVLALSIGLALGPCGPAAAAAASLAPATMARLGSVDERFQSYNVEMVEVTGGYFWRPYDSGGSAPASSAPANMPAGRDPALHAYRKPIDLSHPRLRKLAGALGPVYLRVSGTWANSTYFDDSGGHAAPPAGFNAVLTREQWKGVIEFARAVDARLATSFAISQGTRDARGGWTPDNAKALIAATHSLGGELAAAEFMNEPDLPAIGGAPAGYDAARFARDIAAFQSFLRRSSPSTIFLGPGAANREAAANLLEASGGVFDALSWHHYGAVSQRCSKMVPTAAARDEQALSDASLSAVEQSASFYAALRDKYEPGRPLWITETAAAACGGNPSDSTFLDSFRYLDQLGRMAQHGIQVVIHNTLAASDYGLLDERDFAPRPNYWAALLWRALMGPVVLDPGPSSVPRLHLYAHCLRGRPGGVALLAINTDRDQSRALDLGMPASRYRLTAAHLADTRVRLNGEELRLGVDDELPPIAGEAVVAGPLDLPPASITLIGIADAGNPACL